MSFSILDYTEKLQNVEEKGSWLLADCPVCHAHKLKINSSTGAYKCYANDCSSQKIRDSVAKYTPFVKTNLRVPRKAVRRYLDAEPLYIPFDVLLDLESYFVRCARQEEADRKYYVYSPSQQTVRFISKDGKKIVAPQYLKNTKYVSGTGDSDWLMFNEENLCRHFVFRKYYDKPYIMMAEGEKCAVSVANQTYECLTPAGFCFSPEYLDNAAKRLVTYGLKGVLYFEDNDTAGKKKAHMVSNACWRNNLQCTVINPSFLRSGGSLDDGFDIADSGFEIQVLVYMWVWSLWTKILLWMKPIQRSLY
jgi:putative DNA primase/helicase